MKTYYPDSKNEYPIIHVAGTGFTITRHDGAIRPYRLRHDGRFIGNLSGYDTLEQALRSGLGPLPAEQELQAESRRLTKLLVKGEL
jgi:hypothetical protein